MIISEYSLFSETLNNWKSKCYCFSGSCSVSSNYISSLINVLESLILNREEFFYTFLCKYLEYSLIFDKIGEIAFLSSIILLNLDRLGINVPEFSFRLILNLRNSVTWLSFGHIVDFVLYIVLYNN